MKQPEEIFEDLKQEFGEADLEYKDPGVGLPWIEVSPSLVKEVMKFLRDEEELRFDVLMCLSGVHYPADDAVGVTYHINSTQFEHSLALKVKVPEDDPFIPSVESVWKTANWHEREAWDMVGIRFKDHPNMKRILCAEDWEGHPLRKDYVQQEYYNGIPTGNN